MRIFMNIFVIFAVINELRAVRITELRVPSGASHEAPMDCRYDLETDVLYDVKWYKDGQQFLRCLPSGQIDDYRTDGVQTYHSGYASIGSCQFQLTALNSKSAGEYKCEVTTEGPAFKTAARSSKFRVIVSTTRLTRNETNDRMKETNVIDERSGRNTTWNAYSSNGYVAVIPALYVCAIYLLFIVLHVL